MSFSPNWISRASLLEYQENPRHPAELRSRRRAYCVEVFQNSHGDDIEKLRPELNIEGLREFLDVVVLK